MSPAPSFFGGCFKTRSMMAIGFATPNHSQRLVAVGSLAANKQITPAIDHLGEALSEPSGNSSRHRDRPETRRKAPGQCSRTPHAASGRDGFRTTHRAVYAARCHG